MSAPCLETAGRRELAAELVRSADAAHVHLRVGRLVGRDGRLTALDTDTGAKLWEFPTDGGVNAPPITFERNGRQYVAVYAGGTSPDPANGRLIYMTTCAVCHGENGQGGSHSGIALTSALTVGSIVNTTTNGRNEMPAFGAVMSRDELRDVAAYLLEDLLRE